jgi:hypothetical protein
MGLIFRLIKKPLILIILLLIIALLLKKVAFRGDWFSSKPVIIDNTPLVIKEIKSLAQLNTATLYQEIVVDSLAPGIVSFAVPREIVLIVKGKVTAGINLDEIKDEDISVNGDSIHIILPWSIVKDVILNPSAIETFYEKGKWTNEEITRLKLSARNKLLQEANKSRLLEKADSKARLVMENFFLSAGFRKAVVITRPGI